MSKYFDFATTPANTLNEIFMHIRDGERLEKNSMESGDFIAIARLIRDGIYTETYKVTSVYSKENYIISEKCDDKECIVKPSPEFAHLEACQSDTAVEFVEVEAKNWLSFLNEFEAKIYSGMPGNDIEGPEHFVKGNLVYCSSGGNVVKCVEKKHRERDCEFYTGEYDNLSIWTGMILANNDTGVTIYELVQSVDCMANIYVTRIVPASFINQQFPNQEIVNNIDKALEEQARYCLHL